MRAPKIPAQFIFQINRFVLLFLHTKRSLTVDILKLRIATILEHWLEASARLDKAKRRISLRAFMDNLIEGVLMSIGNTKRALKYHLECRK